MSHRPNSVLGAPLSGAVAVRIVVVVAATLALIASGCASADPPLGTAEGALNVELLEDRADALVDQGVPGVVIRSIGPGGDFTVTAGVSDTETGEAVTGATVFNLGGASNAYLAAAMLQQQSEGAVALGQNVEEFFPGEFSYGWDIAIYDLLQHSSGIPDYVGVGEGRGVVIEACIDFGNCTWEADEIVDLVNDLDRDFQPGEGWGFSNTDYVLAGEIAGQIDGSTWQEVISSRVLDPLNLSDTHLITDLGDVSQAPADLQLAHAYTDLDGDGALDDVTELLPAGAGADGALFASADDAIAFFRPLLRGEFLNDAEQTALFATAPTSFGPEDFGLGVSFIHGAAEPQVGHTGENLGHSVFIEHDLATDTTTVVLINAAGELPDEAWGALLESATGIANRTVRSRKSDGPGQLRWFCTLY